MGKIFVLSVTDHEEYILNRIMEIIAAEPGFDHIVSFHPTIIKSSRSSFAGSDFSGRRRSVASEPSGKIGAMRLQLISKSFADSDILVSCGQRFTYSSMWFLST